MEKNTTEISEETETSEKEASAKSNFKYFLNFIYTFIITLLVIVAIVFAALKITHIDMFTVESGSMEPNYPVGSVVFVKEADAQTIQVGDVITFVFNADNMLVTHRVVDIDTVNRTFTTKGDANNKQDPNPVRWENTVGKVVFCVPKMGAALDFVNDDSKKPYIIAVVVAIGVISIGSDLIERISSKKRRKAEENTAPSNQTVKNEEGGNKDA